MCPRCWAEVPRDIQREVYASWRAFNRDEDGAWERYQAARDKALGAIQ